MRLWKNIIVFILLLTMPLTSWASITAGSHCQDSDSSSHLLHVQMDDEQLKSMHHQMPSEEMDNNPDCECGCSSAYDCSGYACHTTALLSDTEMKFRAPSQSASRLASVFTPTPEPHLLYRPPIYLS
jgi:hypothetical protein